MTTVSCPWCDLEVEVEPALTELCCAECRVAVAIAPDPRPVLAAAA